MICKYIIKRNGERVDFDKTKLHDGLLKAVKSGSPGQSTTALAEAAVEQAYTYVASALDARGFDCVTADEVQRLAIDALNSIDDKKLGEAARKSFLRYAVNRRENRELQKLKGTLQKLTVSAAKDADLKRENANIDGDTAMGTMLRYGSESSKTYSLSEVIPEDIAEAHINGDIHIHDIDFYNLTETCCQIDLSSLFKNGFSTGHGNVREPQGIMSAASLTCIAIQSNQNDQHGGQSIPCFDWYLAPYVTKTAAKEVIRCFSDYLLISLPSSDLVGLRSTIRALVQAYLDKGKSLLDDIQRVDLAEVLSEKFGVSIKSCMELLKVAAEYTDKATYQAMEALVGNLNTMNSRAGAQVPFSSINFGTDTSHEGRMVSRNLMQAQYDGLGNGETSVFPITIFKVKEGVNFEPGTPNYDLYLQALRTTAKRLFPNFAFVDAPFNKKYYREGRPETEVAYMGCRTRVLGNVYDSSREITTGRGNLSFTTINLPRLGILCRGNLSKFYDLLEQRLELVSRQLLHRFSIQCKKKVRNYPFLMGQHVWLDSDKLYTDDEVKDVLRHGTLSIGFIGLAECLVALCGKHHGESDTAQTLGLNIIQFMKDYTTKLAKETGLNWSVLATPAEGLAGRFVKLDKKIFGEIPGVTDKEWYTNSFHIPVEYSISCYRKLELEGPYHALTEGGHISYVELNGDPASNIDALDGIVHHMRDCGVGYGAINHPVDRDPVCGYLGVIGDVCPLCGRNDLEPASVDVLQRVKPMPTGHTYTLRERGEEIKFDRIRRITGYLVGTVDRFNDAKRAELDHRKKHM